MAIQQPKELGPAETTVIGESILVSGKLEGDEDLTVRGRVYGSIALSKTLIIETSGVVKADAKVRNAVVSGVVVGNITASESVHLTREGRMVGDIISPRIIIVEGAAFRGRVDMGAAPSTATDDTAARSAAPALARPAVRTGGIPVARPPAPPPRPAPMAARPTPGPVAKSTSPARPPESQAKPPVPPPPPPAERVSPQQPAAPATGQAPALPKRKVVVKRKR